MTVKGMLKIAGAWVYKNRAKIETVAGMTAVAVGTGIIISKAKKATEVAHEVEDRLDDIRVKDATDDWESKSERSKARVAVLKYAAANYTKTYWLGLTCIGGGLTLIGISDITMNKEIAAVWSLASAYAATLNNVKERVIADQGEEKWQEYLFGPQMTTVETLEDGTVVQTTTSVPDHNGSLGLPPHCFIFDELNCPDSYEKDPLMNRDFLEKHLLWLNDRLWREGFLWENDIRRDLKAPLVKSGWTSGIFAVNEDGSRNFLTFGLDAKSEAAQRFRDGIEPSVMIQLNVEDNILDRLKLNLI